MILKKKIGRTTLWIMVRSAKSTSDKSKIKCRIRIGFREKKVKNGLEYMMYRPSVYLYTPYAH